MCEIERERGAACKVVQSQKKYRVWITRQNYWEAGGKKRGLGERGFL